MGKRKRTKRLFPRKFASDYLNVLSGVDPVKTAAYEIYQNRARVKTTTGGRANASHVKNNTFMQQIPPTITSVPAGVHMNNPRTAVAKRIDQVKERVVDVWQGDKHQGFIEFIRGPLLSDWKGVKVYLWFTGNYYKIIKTGPTFQATSATYTGREQAERVWLSDKIQWIEFVDLTLK